MRNTQLHPAGLWCLTVLVIPLLALFAGVVCYITTEVGELPFDRAEWWWLLGAVPLSGLLYIFGLHRRRMALKRFVSPEVAPLLMRRFSAARQAARAGMVVLALLMIVIAILGPRWGRVVEKQKVRGVDIAVALDVSRSMLATDVTPNRLERAKSVIRAQLSERPVFRQSNRLALLAFAGSSSLRLPLTTDHLAFRNKLAAVQYGAVGKGGTAIAEAIRKGADLFVRSPENATKALLVITDGEDHGTEPVEAAKEVFTGLGVRVFTISVGDEARPAGAEVPASPTAGARPLLHQGQIVFSKVDVAGLQRIAEAGGGQYASLRDLHVVVDSIARMWNTELTTEQRELHQPRYQWFLAAALALLAAETLVRERRSGGDEPALRVWQRGTT